MADYVCSVLMLLAWLIQVEYHILSIHPLLKLNVFHEMIFSGRKPSLEMDGER
jgi:hypothetical protein